MTTISQDAGASLAVGSSSTAEFGGPHTAVVDEVVEETLDVRVLRLVSEDRSPFPPYEAGAHIDVTGPTGILRQYSLCGEPSDSSSLLIAVKREPDSRGGSQALHEVVVGDRLTIGEPRNLLSIDDDADQHVLVAGGIGITPLLNMAHELHRRGAAFTLLYFARSRDEMAFADFLSNGVEFSSNVHLHPGVPRHEQPAVLRTISETLTPRSHVYTCGPNGFMEQVADVFGEAVGADHVHIENFTAKDIDTTGYRPFVVEIDGESYDVPADRTILQVLEEHGIEVFKSCEEGVCGSCVSGVLDGVPDHRDNCLSAADKAANNEMALCVSRALTDKLVIELY